MIDNYLNCIEFVLKSEGGYVNDPHDPGGETNYGISKRAYPNLDIRNLTKAQAILIYRRDYWDKVQGDYLPCGLDLVALDAAVNSGVGQSTKWLQRAVKVKDDGVLGPKTLKALREDPVATTIESALHERLTFMQGLRNWPRYGKGWLNRLQNLHTLAKSFIKTK